MLVRQICRSVLQPMTVCAAASRLLMDEIYNGTEDRTLDGLLARLGQLQTSELTQLGVVRL